MNHDEARALKDGGWHWTTMNDDVVRTAAPCITIDEPFDLRKPYEPPKPENVHRCPPHATKEEAERHFYDYSLGLVTEDHYGNWEGCAVCDAPTKAGLSAPGISTLFSGTALCDAHRTIEHLKELNPFEPGIRLIHS